MRRKIFTMLMLLGALAGSAAADTAEHKNGALGFRDVILQTQNAVELATPAPIGARWWFSEQRVAFDLGFGVSTHKDTPHDKDVVNWSIDAGVPIRVKSWSRVHVLARPGFNYARQESFAAPAPSTEKIHDQFITVTGELETEVFVADNVSFSAGYGLGIVNYNPGEATEKSTTDFTTFGNNFTNLGFHAYLW